MTNETSLTGQKNARVRWFCPKPTVRILFYTDHPFFNLDPDILANEFGLRILKELLIADDSDLATFDITLINRHHQGVHAVNRLTPERLNGFDQVWFFGFLLANKLPMEPANELTDAEVAALRDWMMSGGVLMAGDHANLRQQGHNTNLDRLLGLGRAIGHRVPRAGALRRWEGGPPQEDEEPLVADLAVGGLGPEGFVPQRSHNTQVPTGQAPVDSLALQGDEWPQQLILTRFAEPSSNPFEQTSVFRRVHPLFCGRVSPIDIFPDHMHEGALGIPSVLPPDTWPSGPSGQVLPEVIARGTDKRTGAIHDIVIAYDGSTAGVGRIVADSTWHHYTNDNLKGFPAGGPVLSQLARFYVNLAVWLSPPAKRAEIACWQFWKLLHNPSVLMTYGNSMRLLGSVAADVLRRTAGPCVISQLFDPVLTRSKMSPDVLLPSEELMLGGVLHAFLETFDRVDAGEEVEAELDNMALLSRGLRAAGDDYVRQLETADARARRGRELLEEHLQRRDAPPAS